MPPERPERLDIRLTHEEREMLDALAERRGVSISHLIRSWIRRAAARAKI